MQYTTWGLAGGGCGHAHLSVDAAERCLHRHHRHAKKLGNEAHRTVYRLDDDGYRLNLDDDELNRLHDLDVARFEGRRR